MAIEEISGSGLIQFSQRDSMTVRSASNEVIDYANRVTVNAASIEAVNTVQDATHIELANGSVIKVRDSLDEVTKAWSLGLSEARKQAHG